jgi:hypothetical protein
MAKKPTILSDEEVHSKVSAKSQNSVNWFDSRLSKERERVTRYLNGDLPKRANAGSSSYVSTDVLDSVQQMNSQLLEVFAAGEQIAQFDADQDMNAEACRIATQCARYVIFRENSGYNIFNSVIYDGLTARAGLAKVYWETRHTTSEETFEGLDHDAAMALASQDDVDEFDGTQDAATGLFSGSLVRKKDCSRVCIDPIAPEEFLINPLATSIFEADYVGHRTPKMRSELIDMGYDEKLVMSLPADDVKELQFSPEVLARTAKTSDGSENEEIQEETEYLVLYESYIKMRIDAKKGVRLYKVCHAGGKLLDKPQEVDKAPFLAYVPLPIPHVFFGYNFAAQVIHTQNANTVLFRGVLDHTAITTNSRYFVVNGGLLNPRELLDNRLGGIVNVRRPDSVAAMPQNPLNPYVFQTMQVLDTKNEKGTGISALSQGLNKDAISTQNSRGLVDNMIKVGSGRQKVMARNFAENFFVPLMLEVVRLLIANHKSQKVIEIAGEPLSITPSQWTDRTTCTISMHLGYGEKDMAANELAEGYQMMAKDPVIAPGFGMKQRYEMLHDIAKLKGFNRFSAYLDPNAPPPGPDPMKVRELDIKERGVAATERANDFKQADASRLYATEQVKLQQKDQELQVNALNVDRTNDRQDADTTARIQQGEEKLDIEREAVAAKERTDARNAAAKAAQAAAKPAPKAS